MKTTSDKVFLDFMVEIALQAGAKLVNFQKNLKKLKVTHKYAEGVVSRADIETEKYIISKIKSRFKGHAIFAEESSFIEGVKSKEVCKLRNVPYCWIIDPLDGTHNFLNGSDYFAVSIALVSFGKAKLGVVYRPSTGEIFQAIDGLGSWFLKSGARRREKLYLENNKKALKDSLLVTGFTTEKGIFNKEEYELFGKVMANCRGVRRFGSAALDLCYVAKGVWDGFWERELAPWDVSAAGLICQESGVTVTNFSGEEFDPFHNSILAARRPLYQKLIGHF